VNQTNAPIQDGLQQNDPKSRITSTMWIVFFQNLVANINSMASTAVTAATSAIGAVLTFNGRTGDIIPQIGDYYVAQVNGAAPLASPSLTGVPTAPTAAVDTNSTQLATTAFVDGQAGTATPLMDGTATVGTSLRYSRQDHIHASDTSRQATGNYLTALTGGVTASGPGSSTATVVTNANLTGPITSVGNATVVASQTGTGSKFVMDTSPVLVAPTATSLAITAVGNGVRIKEGSNAKMGVATLVGGTVTVANTSVTAVSRIFLTTQGGTLTNVSDHYISARTAGTSFTITSLNILDASTIAYIIFEPS
jgi:hypothetical protein